MSPKRQFVPAHTKTRNLRVVIIVAAIAVIFAVPMLRNGLRYGASVVGTEIGRGTHSVGGFFSYIGTGFRSKNALEAQNVQLSTENAQLETEVADTDTLSQELDSLKATMGRATATHLTLAAVLEKPPHSPYDTLVIDGGTSAGFAAGQIVYANGDTPIGTVDQVSASSAVVKLYSAPGESTEARLATSGTDITLTGRGGGDFSAQVPQGLAVATGETAVSKDINPHVVAVFQKVTSDPRDPFQTLLLSVPVNVNDLSFVEVAE